MRFRTPGVAALVLVTAACAGLGAGVGTAPVRTIEVALVAAFSGPESATGQDLRNGLELEARAIDAAGGLLGARVEVVAADGGTDPASAAELVREQAGDAGVGLVVGPDTTEAFRAALPALDASGVPSCLTRVADEALGLARSSFRAGAANGVEVAALVSALQRTRPDLHRVALLDDGDDLGRSYDALLATRAPGAGLAYVGRAAAGADPAAALQQLAGQGAQVVVVARRPAGAAAAARAAAQLGAGRPVLAGFGAVADPGFATLGGDAAVGALLVATPPAALASLAQSRWPAGYRAFVATAGQQYGLGAGGSLPPADPAASDCLLQWARAVRQAGTFAGDAVTRAWERLDVPASETALGVRERLTPTDHSAVAASGLTAYRWVRDGSRTRLQPA